MSELELRLNALRDEIAWPETPSLEPAYEPRRPGAPRACAPLALGFAVLLAVLAGVLALLPGARSAFLEIFQHPRRHGRAGGRAARGRRAAARLRRAGQPRGGGASRRLRLVDLGEPDGDLRP